MQDKEVLDPSTFGQYDLIPIEGLDLADPEDKALLDELTVIRKKNFREALRNMVTGETPDKHRLYRPGKGKREWAYVTGHYAAFNLNALFGYMWDLYIKEVEFKAEGKPLQVRAVVGLRIKRPGRTITTTYPDGTVVVEKIDPFEITKEQYGRHDVQYLRDDSKIALDLGNDCKSAVTDGMKKCTTELGFFRDVYEGKEKEEGIGTTKEAAMVFKWAEKINKNEEEVQKDSQDKFGVSFESLTQGQLLDLMAEYRSAAQQQG